MSEIIQACRREYDARTRLDAARAATNSGAPMYIEAKYEARWREAYCHMMQVVAYDMRQRGVV